MAKYDLLETHLKARAAAGSTSETLDAAQFATLLGSLIPPSAWVEETSFWGNTSNKQRRQAAAWMGVGWKVDSVDYVQQSVTFIR